MSGYAEAGSLSFVPKQIIGNYETLNELKYYCSYIITSCLSYTQPFVLFTNSMYSLIVLHSADSALGRVDLRSLSDQTLMELLIDGFDEESKQRYKDKDGMYLDVCKWSCVKCDRDHRVTEVNEKQYFTGSLQLSYMPPKVKTFYIQWHRLEGSIDLMNLPEGLEYLGLNQSGFMGSMNLTKLPESMKELALFENKLTGTIDLTQLPERMQYLLVFNNLLEGSLDLTRLPGSMKYLYLFENSFTGSVNLEHLPESMEDLEVADNRLVGSIGLTNLPAGMKRLSIDNNQFQGSFIARNLPPRLEEINASGNKFCATAVVDSKTNAQIDLGVSGVTSVIDEKGKVRVGVHF